MIPLFGQYYRDQPMARYLRILSIDACMIMLMKLKQSSLSHEKKSPKCKKKKLGYRESNLELHRARKVQLFLGHEKCKMEAEVFKTIRNNAKRT
jgi:hypothetical protein